MTFAGLPSAYRDRVPHYHCQFCPADDLDPRYVEQRNGEMCCDRCAEKIDAEEAEAEAECERDEAA